MNQRGPVYANRTVGSEPHVARASTWSVQCMQRAQHVRCVTCISLTLMDRGISQGRCWKLQRSKQGQAAQQIG
jgi:hypothetical protein